MEYCPEIAVLHSAFELVSKKTGQALSDLPKEKCHEYVKIITTTIEEICTGIAHDLGQEEKLLWQEKLHLVHFYALVKKKYKGNENQKAEGKVPVCGVLDMITGILPTYSNSFFFELMKENKWTEKFLRNLQCLDYKTAALLFEDLLFHCYSNPLTLEDRKVITMVKDKLLSRCLCVPEYPSELCEKHLEPLNQSGKFVQTVYPEDSVLHNEKSVTMAIKNGSKLGIQFDLNTNSTKVGINFLDIYVEKNPKILDTIMTLYESVLENTKHGPKETLSQELLETVSQLGIWIYLGSCMPDSDDASDRWFIHNVQVPECGQKPDCVKTMDLVYSLNFTLLQSIFKCFPQRRLHSCLQNAVRLVLDLLKHGDNSRMNENAISVQMLKQNIQVVAGLTVNLTVLLRMLIGKYSYTETSESMVQKCGVTESLDAEMVDNLKKVQRAVEEVQDIEEGIFFGRAWREDATLEALLRRIDHKLPQYQVCVDKLLEDRNMRFLTVNRICSVMNRHPTLLSRVDRVLRLTHIMDSLKGDSCEQRAQLLQDLFCVAFSKLSFPDQDTVVMEIYCNGHYSVPAFFKEGLARKVTNVFNKVTSDLDNQVLCEVILLCLGDPVLVLRTAINLCVRNEQQAVNCALIMQQLAKTCMSRHPIQHPDKSLIALVVQDFLNSQPLTEKEQKCFHAFVSELIKQSASSASKGPVLAPAEFLHTSVLPCVSIDNLLSTNIVTCNFAASLLLLGLEAGCNKNCDWSEYEFEPMALVLSLVEVQHECVVLWEMKNQISEEENEEEENARVGMQTNSSKLVLKETVNQCLAKLCQMVHDGFFSIQQNDVRWLLEVTSDLHWTIKFRLCPLLSACHFEQYTSEWLMTLDSLLGDLNPSMVPVLQFVAVDRTLVPRILHNISEETQVDSSELISALIQVLPQCLMSEFESVVMFLEGLQTTDTVHVSLTYRLKSTYNLPLMDFSKVRPALYTSQLLGDMIICLATTLTSGEERVPALPHAVQCYISVMKTRCDQVIERKDLQLFYLGELFHHVCEVTFNLTAEIMDSTLVYLLHILNKFKDVVKAIVKGHKKVEVSTSVLKMVKNIEDGMITAVQGLPDNCEEKHMILKKLSDQL